MAKIIQGNFPQKKRKTGKSSKTGNAPAVYQLKISLFGSDPLIWRRVQVSADMTLARLHDVIQLCMGWTDTHMHQFMVGNNFYGSFDDEDDWGEAKANDEADFTLLDLESDIPTRFLYEYDFGDGWQHAIEIEEVTQPEKGWKHPVLLAGERACPPEDIGGIPGYEDFLSILKNRESEEYEEMLEWYGSDDFDPNFFEMEEVNMMLKKIT